MRLLLLRGVILVVLTAMLGGHVTELFDRWDHTLRTGKDADYTVVCVAACIGIAVVGIRKLTLVLTRLSVAEKAPASSQRLPNFHGALIEPSATGPSPPLLLPIRI